MWGLTSLGETRWGWKFGLTPLPSLRSKAHNLAVHIWAQFAFKLSHANFPNCITYSHTTWTLYLLPAILKHAFPTFVVLKAISFLFLYRYFLHGVCRQGASCTYAHDKSAKPSNVCRYYLAGNCSYGAGCRYEHHPTLTPQCQTYFEGNY